MHVGTQQPFKKALGTFTGESKHKIMPNNVMIYEQG